MLRRVSILNALPAASCRAQALKPQTPTTQPTDLNGTPLVDMMRRSVTLRSILFALAWVIFVAQTLPGQTALARVVVYKSPALNRAVGSSLPPFAPITSGELAARGFTLVMDYPGRAVYEGPASAAPGLITALSPHYARLATDLDVIDFNDLSINVATGTGIPTTATAAAPTASDGLYLVALRSYPTLPWINDLTARGVHLVEALPPASYLVRGPRATLDALRTAVRYVQAVFPVSPAMKKTLFRPMGSVPQAARQVFIQTAELAPAESLAAYLTSLDPTASEQRSPGRVSYRARLSDTDIDTLTHFDLVYSVSPIGVPGPETERQGMLVLQPLFNGGRQELPATSPDYYQLLQSYGLADFSNTRIGIIDSGLDNGVMSGPTVHPDFATPGQLDCTSPFTTGCQDLLTHGTANATVIAGYADFGPRWAGYRADNGQYRYGLGLAPKCHLTIARTIDCRTIISSLPQILGDPNSPMRQTNVINYSFANAGVTGYDSDSQELDRRTRTQTWLFTVSAGNAGNGQPDEVRPPATAKNVIAVGATENFTNVTGSSGSWPRTNPNPPLECAWGGYSPWGPPEGNFSPEDAQNIPTYSAHRNNPHLPSRSSPIS